MNGADDGRRTEPYLPDFCQPRMALAVVLIAELLAMVLTFSRHSIVEDFWLDLARVSLFLLWVALASAWILCKARPRLHGMSAARLTLVAFVLILTTTLAISEATYWLGRYAQGPFSMGPSAFFPAGHAGFLLGNLGICAIVSTLVLRYFYVAHQWRMNVEMEARSRVSALQARIRPHFLFNSMNTIAALTRSDPVLAEQAVEDLADLFRASLADVGQQIRMKEELEMTRMYQRIEQLRLGERLSVEWHVAGLPMRALIPALTVQPLLENAIYHGVEPMPDGGLVSIEGAREDDMLSIRITNPLPPGSQLNRHSGNRMALANIRERLLLAYGDRARVDIDSGADHYCVTLVFPYRETHA